MLDNSVLFVKYVEMKLLLVAGEKNLWQMCVESRSVFIGLLLTRLLFLLDDVSHLVCLFYVLCTLFGLVLIYPMK